MNYQDQLTLLKDILKNQQQVGYGTVDEFDQMYRLTQSLQEQDHFDPFIQQTFLNIAQYCSTGSCSSNKNDLNEWIESIDQLTLSSQ